MTTLIELHYTTRKPTSFLLNPAHIVTVQKYWADMNFPVADVDRCHAHYTAVTLITGKTVRVTEMPSEIQLRIRDAS